MAAWRIHESLVGNKNALSLESFWPLKEDNEQKESFINVTKEEYTEWWDNMKKIHKF